MFEQRLDAMKKEIEEAKGDAREELEKQAAFIGTHLDAQKEIKPRPPTVTLSDRLSLFHGEREIQVHFLGRGHTGGDVARAPAERGRAIHR